MRLRYLLLIAGAALVAGCDTVSATTDSQQVKPSTLISTNAELSITAARPERNGKRSLRISKRNDKDDLESTGEERGLNTGTLTKQLSKLTSFKGSPAALQKVDDALAAVQSPKFKILEQNLMTKLSKNELAQKNFYQYLDEKWTIGVLKTKLGIAKGMAPDSKEYEAFSALLQTRMYVDTLMKIKNPTSRNTVENILTKVADTPLSQKFFGQYMDGTLTQAALKKELGITRNTAKTSQEYKAFALLLDTRAFNNILAKTKVNSLKDNLLGRVTENPLAQKFFKEFMDNKWSTKTLQSKLGITKDMAPDSKEFEALSALLQTRIYINGVANGKTQTMRTTTENLLTKLDDNPFAKQYFGKYMDDSFTMTDLKTKLKITRSTPYDSQEYQAVVLLIQARAMNKL